MKKIYQIIQNHKISQIIGYSVFAAMLLALLMVFENNIIDIRWLYGGRSYSTLGVDWQQGIVYRLSLYALASILGMALLLMTSKIRRFYTAYGEDTLYIYVLHGFVMKGLVALGIYKYVDNEWKVIVLMIASLMLLPILRSHSFKVSANFLMNPTSFLSKKFFVK